MKSRKVKLLIGQLVVLPIAAAVCKHFNLDDTTTGILLGLLAAAFGLTTVAHTITDVVTSREEIKQNGTRVRVTHETRPAE